MSVPRDLSGDAAHALVVPPADHDVLALRDARMAVAAHAGPLQRTSSQAPL